MSDSLSAKKYLEKMLQRWRNGFRGRCGENDGQKRTEKEASRIVCFGIDLVRLAWSSPQSFKTHLESISRVSAVNISELIIKFLGAMDNIIALPARILACWGCHSTNLVVGPEVEETCKRLCCHWQKTIERKK